MKPEFSDKISNSHSTEENPVNRLLTREVHIGNIPLGGGNPIRIQSMTTTDTMDTKGTVEQCIRIIKAGADYVRITAPSISEANNLRNIKNELKKRGYKTPLIADIHFTPNAAEAAARIVEKVRINPGNYIDRKKFEQREYSDSEYAAELEKIRERFLPLVKICKEYGTAMRIGANHGSLSDRIMNRYGDTPLGMVESAMEFVRICVEEGYYSIVLSMKASNPIVMVHAYRLLVHKMMERCSSASQLGDSSVQLPPIGGIEGGCYPLHLGVTEAGEGLDARVKSAVGIGTLLEEGIGDTIRVSLAEEPEYEVPVAIALAQRVQNLKSLRHTDGVRPKDGQVPSQNSQPVTQYNKHSTRQVADIGGRNVPVVIGRLPAGNLSVQMIKNNPQRSDYYYADDLAIIHTITGQNKIICNYPVWKKYKSNTSLFPLFNSAEYLAFNEKSSVINFISVTCKNLTDEFLEKIKSDKTAVLVIESAKEHCLIELRQIFLILDGCKCQVPVIIRRNYENIHTDDFCLFASTDFGGLLLDGFGDGIWPEAPSITTHDLTETAFSILQATRTRISRTDFVACPSCGRTLFNLQETTLHIKEKTSHLKGIKIAVMGCIVNGPGEMADADYGYVGTGPGKISLYKGKEIIERNIPSGRAVEALVELIKKNGDWAEPENATEIVENINK